MQSQHSQFTPPSPAIEARVSAILDRLNLETKIRLLGGQRPPDRDGDTYGHAAAGIPPLKFADASVGIHWWTDRSTTYPATIALAATWDPELAYRAGAALGRDARARGVHVVLGPGVNLYRSPLCGRNFEYMGEDPRLAARTVTAFVRGLQDQGVAATVKHFAVNYQEFDRHRVSSDVDERTLREVYLAAFQAAVETGGCAALMTAYNPVNRVPASEHDWLIRRVLKGEWGFLGLVMSDWVSTYSAVNAANAGLDLEMPHATWMTPERLLPAVRQGLVDPAVIDDKVRRLLRLMACFGWLDHPQQDPAIPLEDPDSAAVALEIARRGCVLLKNVDGLLPLDPARIGSLAVIGPGAERTPIGGGGSAWNKPWRRIGILEGLRRAYGEERVRYARGLPSLDSDAAFRDSRFLTPDGTPGLVAEYFNTPDWSGAPVLTRVEPRMEQRWGSGPIAPGVNTEAFTVRWTGLIRPERSGPHVIYPLFAGPFRVRVDGQVIFDILDDANLKPPRTTLRLEAGGTYAIEVWYRSSPGNNVACVGWEQADSGTDRDEALTLARTCEAVVFCGGFTEQIEGEGDDRAFALPAEQEALIRELAAANPRLVVVLTAGGNVDMRRWIDAVGGLLMAWYPGQEGGTAVAQILSGAVNPSGRLPATFERALEDRAAHAHNAYHDADGDKRVLLAEGVFTGHRHHDRTGIAPLFPFGFGLSYTTFEYARLACPEQMHSGETLTVRVEVRNTGAHAGTEVVQLYLHDREASVPRPDKELKAFAAVPLEPGEQRTVALELTERDLMFFCPQRRAWVAEPGEFEVRVGASAADIRLTACFRYRT